MKMKAHLKFYILKLLEKNFSKTYSDPLPLYFILLSNFVCSLSRLSQINAQLREMCARKTCQSCAAFV